MDQEKQWRQASVHSVLHSFKPFSSTSLSATFIFSQNNGRQESSFVSTPYDILIAQSNYFLFWLLKIACLLSSKSCCHIFSSSEEATVMEFPYWLTAFIFGILFWAFWWQWERKWQCNRIKALPSQSWTGASYYPVSVFKQRNKKWPEHRWDLLALVDLIVEL